MTSNDILKQYRSIEKERIIISGKISDYGDSKQFDLMNKAIDKYNYLTDKLETLDKNYKELKRIEQ